MLNINFLNKHVIFIERKDLETNHRGRELIPSPSCDLKRNFFFREFQPMASASDDSSLSSNQDTNQFLV